MWRRESAQLRTNLVICQWLGNPAQSASTNRDTNGFEISSSLHVADMVLEISLVRRGLMTSATALANVGRSIFNFLPRGIYIVAAEVSLRDGLKKLGLLLGLPGEEVCEAHEGLVLLRPVQQSLFHLRVPLLRRQPDKPPRHLRALLCAAHPALLSFQRLCHRHRARSRPRHGIAYPRPHTGPRYQSSTMVLACFSISGARSSTFLAVSGGPLVHAISGLGSLVLGSQMSRDMLPSGSRPRYLSPGTKNFFGKTSFTQRLPPLSDRTIFGRVFGRGGMSKI